MIRDDNLYPSAAAPGALWFPLLSDVETECENNLKTIALLHPDDDLYSSALSGASQLQH